MLGAGLDAAGDGLQVEEGATAGGAGHVIGLERAAARGLQDVVSQPQGLARARFAADQDGVADAVGQQRADDGRGAEQGDLRLQRRGFEAQAILQQDGIGPAQPLSCAASSRNAAMAGNGVPSFTVTSWVSQFSSKSRVGSISWTFRSS